jgi:sugar phosphate isomerase/epimerase
MQLLLNTIMLEPNRWTAEHELTYPLVDLLAPIAVAGFAELELWGYHVDSIADGEVDRLAQGLDDHSLRAVGLGAYPSFHLAGAEDEEQRRRLERLVEIASRLGSDVFKIFPGRVASADADEAVWKRSAKRMIELSQRLCEHGMTLTLETHGGTLCDTLDSTHQLLERLPAEGVGICFQPYVEDDTDAAMAAFDTLMPRVQHVHLQNRGPGRVASLLADGEWTDYTRFLPHVRASGFDGPMCIEFTAGITPPEGVAFDLDLVLSNAGRDRDFIESVWSS